MSRKPSERRQRSAPDMPIVLQRRPLRAALNAIDADAAAILAEAAETPAPLVHAPATGRRS